MGIAAVVAAGVGAAGTIYASSKSADASKQAARMQAQASGDASAVQLAMFDETRGSLQPYMDAGQNSGLNPLTQQMSSGFLSGMPNGYNPIESYQGIGNYSPMGQYNAINYNPVAGYQNFAPTMENLENTPGYQFSLDQGLKATTNQASAAGLAGSGAHGKALAGYAQGLASTTYQQQLQNYMNQYTTGLNSNISQYNTAVQGGTNQYNTMLNGNISQYNTALQGNLQEYNALLNSYMGQSQLGFNMDTQNQANLYNRLMGVTQLGQSSAAGVGAQGTQVAQSVGNNLIGAGNAAASGAVGSANAWGQGISNTANSLGNAYMTNALMSQYGQQGAAGTSALSAAGAGPYTYQGGAFNGGGSAAYGLY